MVTGCPFFLIFALWYNINMEKTNYILNKYTYNLMLAKSAGHDVYVNEFKKLSNSYDVREKFDYRFKLKDLFKEYWPSFKELHINNLRPSVIDNVEKMINCKDLSNGYLCYSCNKCDNYHLTGLSCNSRFCSTCGKKYRDERSIEIQSKLIDVSHRHFVFTVAKELRVYFFTHRELFNTLFDAVNDTLTSVGLTSKKDIKNKTKLGFVAFLHTYGRDLKANPHIHVLLAEAKVGLDNKVLKCEYFHFDKLRKHFMYSLLNKMDKYLKANATYNDYWKFANDKRYLINEYKDVGFYIYGPKNNSKMKDIKEVANYIARYGSHPAISESRIENFDYINDTVTYKFDPHEDDGLDENDLNFSGTQIVTLNVYDFMIKLIRHIPDKGFNLIRYFGFYSNKTNLKPKRVKLLKLFKVKVLKEALRFKKLILSKFGFDLFKCRCGGTLELNYELSYLPMKGALF